MTDDEHSTSPVRKARDRALEAKLRYDQGRHGLADRDLTTLRRQWQTYLWHYYGQIAGYKETRNIRDKWHQPIDAEDHPDSLAEIEAYQFASQIRTERGENPFTGVTEKRDIPIPSVWPADALRAINAKLDECYHELGFDEPPRKVVKHSGYLGSEHPEWFADEFTLDVWREFIETVAADEDAPESLDDAVELAVGEVQRAQGEEP